MHLELDRLEQSRPIIMEKIYLVLRKQTDSLSKIQHPSVEEKGPLRRISLDVLLRYWRAEIRK
jgi:hypothetical protein